MRPWFIPTYLLMNKISLDPASVKKWNIPGPRYTSYPTAPIWKPSNSNDLFKEKLAVVSRKKRNLSLYLHIPFCQELCLFCGCHTLIRKPLPHYGDEYLQHLFTEIDMVASHLNHSKPEVRQLHWGGGTPTFLNESQITSLMRHLHSHFSITKDAEIAIEIDPRTVTYEKMSTLKHLGFNRVSFGVQDFNPKVQQAIHRIQPFSQVKDVMEWARELRFISLNTDLIYGLPYQTEQSFTETMEQLLSLSPDRVALYSFAYVPWLKPFQKKMPESAFPSPEEKINIFLNARRMFLQQGYVDIGMDHFSKSNDELAKALGENTLYRNFMGYTVRPADEYIGFGVSAISYIDHAFFQNEKHLKDYKAKLSDHTSPIAREMLLSKDDQIRSWVIQKLMCRFKLDKREFKTMFNEDFSSYFHMEIPELKDREQHGLLSNYDHEIQITPLGKVFVRNIAMVFDKYLNTGSDPGRFSKTV